MPELANRLREARGGKGWTQAELAARIGVSRKTVNTVENGVFTPLPWSRSSWRARWTSRSRRYFP